MAYLIDSKIGAELDQTSTEIGDTLGNVYNGSDGSKYVYVQASGAITLGDYVTIDEDFQAAAGTKDAVDDGHTIGFATNVAFADDEYGYVALTGRPSVRVGGSCAADVPLYTSATAGVLDDSSTSQTKVDGVVLVTTNGTATVATGEVIATYPKSTTF